MIRLFAAVLALSVAWAPAAAVEIRKSGRIAVLSGPIKFGDENDLRDFLQSPAGADVKVLLLHNSPGGYILPAREMARIIRAKGLSTVVDAARGYCFSACTALFTAGTARHYLNAGGGGDGKAARRLGLGFHEGGTRFSGRAEYSGPGTAEMINIYYEMGVPGAASLVQNAEHSGIYRISGETALKLGIATSLSPP